MNELLQEMAGWLGVHSRWPVVAQLVTVPVVWILVGALGQRLDLEESPTHS